MNTSPCVGETSCKRQENGDVLPNSDRPLKKARYAWQVKGKHHLKTDPPESNVVCPSAQKSNEKADSSSESDNDANDLVGNTEQNLEILGDYLLKQDFNTLDSVITESDKSFLKPCPNIGVGSSQCPRYIGSYEMNGTNSSRSSLFNEGFCAPMSLVHNSRSFNEDQCIARWQAKQMAKGFVDNTINRVLDSWMGAPLPAEYDNRIIALEVAEFINNLPGDNSIENEGILMAISAHGLQNTSNASTSSAAQKNDKTEQSSSSKTLFPSPPSSPMAYELADDEMSQESSNKEKENSNSKSDSDSEDANYCQDTFNPFNLFPRDNAASDISCPNFYADNVLGNDDGFANHFDFMDAAVSFAIQNKGLTSTGTDYG